MFRLVRVALHARRVLRFLVEPDHLGHVVLAFCATLLIGGYAFTLAEPSHHLSIADGLWWAMTTASTVGYGDVYPFTLLGRVIAVVVMLAGAAMFSSLAAAVLVTASPASGDDDSTSLKASIDEVSRELAALRLLVADGITAVRAEVATEESHAPR
jgi:voltage-gated potassium channel